MTQHSGTTPQEVHQQAIRASIAEVTGLLQDTLSRRLTAYIAGVKEAKTVGRWVSGEIEDVRDPLVEQRLRTAYEIVLMLGERDSPKVVRAWFIGLNPQLGDVSPAEVLREGRLKDVLAAARAFTVGG